MTFAKIEVLCSFSMVVLLAIQQIEFEFPTYNGVIQISYNLPNNITLDLWNFNPNVS